MNELSNFRDVYQRIIEHVSDDTVNHYFSVLDLEDTDRYFRHIISEPDVFMTMRNSVIRYSAYRQSQNPIFKYLVDTVDTLSIIKILLFNCYHELRNNFDYQGQYFVLDDLLNPIRTGDYIISGSFSIYRVQDITKNLKIKVKNGPGLTKKYKYYYPSAIRKMPNVTNEFT